MRLRILCLLVFVVGICQWPLAVPAAQSTQDFVAPKINQVRLDWCRHWARECGKPAAELFCRQMGFSKAVRFSIDSNVGARGVPTVVFGDGRLCKAPYCSGFRIITCERETAKMVSPQTVTVPKAPPIGAEKTVPQVSFPKSTSEATSEKNSATLKKKAASVIAKPQRKPGRKVEVVAATRKFPLITHYRRQSLRKVSATWVGTLKRLKFYPAGAALYKCGSGDCSVSSSADFEIDPVASTDEVWLNYSVSKIPHADRALWQISHQPFPAFNTEHNPPGLVASGSTRYREGGFSFDPKAALKLSGLTKNAIFHARVLPVAGAGNGEVVGQASNVMRVYYGVKPPPQEPVKIYTKTEVPGSAPQLQLLKLEFEPFKQIERWPPGCQTWEEKYGEEETFFEEVGDFFTDAWDFASGAYQWAKDQVIALASALTFELIPKDVFKYALDAALVSVGIPPDIPNLSQLMREGVDGLAKEFAKAAVAQIPTGDLAVSVGNLAADVGVAAAANMAEDELRDRLRREIEDRSKQAIVSAADEMKRQMASQGKSALCQLTEFHPVFHVKVRNTGQGEERNVKIVAGASPVYKSAPWTVDLRAGETITLVGVGEPILPGGPYSHPLLTEKQRHDEDLERWYRDILYERSASIRVDVSGGLNCLGGDPNSQFCERKMVRAHESPQQKVTRPYSYGP
jgi:hypothetical protein